MAKNTNSSVFRRLDIDQFCEDNFQDDVVDLPVGEGPLLSDNDTFARLESQGEEIRTLLATGQLIPSLQLALRDPPVKCKDQLLKDMACK